MRVTRSGQRSFGVKRYSRIRSTSLSVIVLFPIVELDRSRRLMSSHLLDVLEPSVVLQVNCDAGRTPGVTSYRREKTRRVGPLPDSRQDVVAV